MRDRLEIQERALCRLVSLGEAAYHVTLPEQRTKKGELKAFANRLLKRNK